MDSFRDIKEIILWVTGITHPSHLTIPLIGEYLNDLPKFIDMIPCDNIRIKEVWNICLPDGTLTDGIHGFQLWKTSGVAVYTWNKVGKISITIHTCKEFDIPKTLSSTVAYFHIQDYDWKVVYSSGNYFEQYSKSYRRKESMLHRTQDD